MAFRKRYKKKKSVLSAPARKQVAKIAKAIVSERNFDKKFIIENTPLIGNIMGYVDCTQITTGSSNYQRDPAAGGAIFAKRVRISTYWYNTVNQTSTARLVVFVWRPDMDGQNPAGSGNAPYDSNGTTYAPQASVRTDDYDKIKVLYESKPFVITDTLQSTRHVIKTVDIKLNRRVLYTNADNDGDTGTGHIILGLVSDNAASPVTVACRYSVQLWFEEQ